MLDAARDAIKLSSRESSVYIGADSKIFYKHGTRYAKYCTVVILHKDSKHGCQVFHSIVTKEDFGNIKARLLTEVQMALEVAQEILDVLDDRHLELHVDLNPNPKYKSNVAVKEAIGWVTGVLGFPPKLKHNSWAASSTADYMVKH